MSASISFQPMRAVCVAWHLMPTTSSWSQPALTATSSSGALGPGTKPGRCWRSWRRPLASPASCCTETGRKSRPANHHGVFLICVLVFLKYIKKSSAPWHISKQDSQHHTFHVTLTIIQSSFCRRPPQPIINLIYLHVFPRLWCFGSHFSTDACFISRAGEKVLVLWKVNRRRRDTEKKESRWNSSTVKQCL